MARLIQLMGGPETFTFVFTFAYEGLADDMVYYAVLASIPSSK